MYPVKANIHVQNLYGHQLELFAAGRQITVAGRLASLHRHSSSDRIDIDNTRSRAQSPTPQPDKLTRGRAARRRRGDAGSPSAERQPDKGASPAPPAEIPTAKLASVRSELDVTRGELSTARADAAKLADRCTALERALREANETLRARERELDDLKKEREFLMDRRPRAHSRDREHRSRHDTHRHSTNITRAAYDPDYRDQDDAGHLRVRSPFHGRRPKSTPPAPRSAVSPGGETGIPPIPGLEVFLTKVDHWSGAQVIEAVQDLNSEILQLSAAATELTNIDGRAVAPPARVNQAAKGVASRLGEPFAHILATRDHDHDPVLIQFALQACVATCTARLLSVFCIGLPMMPNELFAQLHYHMHATEPQATSSRWRALTLSHIRALNPRLNEVAIQDFIVQILRAWADIFVLCGCSNPEIPLLSLDALRAHFGPQAHRIAIAACSLARVVTEEIMSTNFEVVFMKQGAAFDVKMMTNAFAGYGPSDGAVLCTTELGLVCSTRKNARAVADGLVRESIDRTTLLLPKVILETVPQILDRMNESGL